MEIWSLPPAGAGTFLSGSDVRLPVGTWDITALATFTEGGGCDGGRHSMTATLRVTVGG